MPWRDLELYQMLAWMDLRAKAYTGVYGARQTLYTLQKIYCYDFSIKNFIKDPSKTYKDSPSLRQYSIPEKLFYMIAFRLKTVIGFR